MFGIGFSEILVVAVIALLVLGPERLPKAARFAGLWVRRARAQWYSVKAELQRELAAEDLRKTLAGQTDELNRMARSLSAGVSGASSAVSAEARAIEESLKRAAGDPVAAPGSDHKPTP